MSQPGYVWTLEMDATLIELLRHELLGGDFVANHAWDLIKQIFVTKHCPLVTISHLQSRYTFYKSIYIISKDMQQNVGFMWDDVQSTIVGNDIKWDAYNEFNPLVFWFKGRSLPFIPDLVQLFNNNPGRGRSSNFNVREDKILLDLLVDEYHKNYAGQGTFKAHVYTDIVERFNAAAKTRKEPDSLKNRFRNLKKSYHMYEQLRGRTGWGWNHQKNLPQPPDEEGRAAAIASNPEYKKLLDKPFLFIEQMDILCGKTTVRGSHFVGTTQEVDVEGRRSFGDDDESVGRGQFSAMGLNPTQIESLHDDNFNPFDFLSASQQHPQPYQASQASPDCTPTNPSLPDDEANSPVRRRNASTSGSTGRKRKHKKAIDSTTLATYCTMNTERINLVRSLFSAPGASASTPQEQEKHAMRECIVRLKSLPGYTRALLFRASALFQKPEKRAWFMALDDEDALAWVVEDTS